MLVVSRKVKESVLIGRNGEVVLDNILKQKNKLFVSLKLYAPLGNLSEELILKEGEMLVFMGGEIFITSINTKGVRIAFDFPKNIKILRSELTKKDLCS